jgi:hypothetical protein
MLGEGCFGGCVSLTSLAFESESILSRIEAGAFAETGLIEIVIPASVAVLGDGCFVRCVSLLHGHLTQSRNWHELKSRLSVELA